MSLILDVVRFELRRSMTWGRMAIWILLVLFPIVIIAAMRTIASFEMGGDYDPAKLAEPFGFTLYFLIPEVCCLLGLLLWATPVISTEVEGQTWIYLATRKSGRMIVLLGKYLAAVLWTFSAVLVANLVCIAILGAAGGFRLAGVMIGLSLISCVAHGALYVLIGVFAYRRTMVVAVAYTLLVEYGLSFVPALVNKLTINYRLRGLLADWMGWDNVRSAAENVFGTEPPSTHLLFLLAITLTLLAVSLYQVKRAEYPT